MPEPSSERVPRGRPRSGAAASHAAIMDAVYALLQEKPARDLTMDAVAKRAKVGKPTLYKWWPSKSALILALFQERIDRPPEVAIDATAEQAIRRKIRRLIELFNGLFGRVMADLIAEGQSEPALLRELYEQHMRPRRAGTVADLDRGKAAGEFAGDTDPELLIDALFGAIYYRLLLRSAPLTAQYGDALVDQLIRGLQGTAVNKRKVG